MARVARMARLAAKAGQKAAFEGLSKRHFGNAKKAPTKRILWILRNLFDINENWCIPKQFDKQKHVNIAVGRFEPAGRIAVRFRTG